MNDIIQDVKNGINNQRSGEGMSTKWKGETDVTSKKLFEFLRILEYRDKEKLWKRVDKKLREKHLADPVANPNAGEFEFGYNDAKANWEKEMKLFMPVNYKFLAIPMQFTYKESSQIRSLIIDEARTLFMRNKEKIFFSLVGKIFPYPNGINSIRLILGIFFNKLEGMDNKA
jgi:hypothetical protein